MSCCSFSPPPPAQRPSASRHRQDAPREADAEIRLGGHRLVRGQQGLGTRSRSTARRRRGDPHRRLLLPTLGVVAITCHPLTDPPASPAAPSSPRRPLHSPPLPPRHRLLLEDSRWEQDWKASWPLLTCSSCSAQKTHNPRDLMEDTGCCNLDLRSSPWRTRWPDPVRWVVVQGMRRSTEPDQVVERKRRREAVELERIGSQCRAVQSRSGRVVPRPHSMGHSLAAPHVV